MPGKMASYATRSTALTPSPELWTAAWLLRSLRWQDPALHQRLYAVGPGVARAQLAAAEAVRYQRPGLGVPDHDLHSVDDPRYPRDNAGHRLVGAEPAGQRRLAAVAMLNAPSRYARSAAGIDDAVTPRGGEQAARVLGGLLELFGVDGILGDDAAAAARVVELEVEYGNLD